MNLKTCTPVVSEDFPCYGKRMPPRGAKIRGVVVVLVEGRPMPAQEPRIIAVTILGVGERFAQISHHPPVPLAPPSNLIPNKLDCLLVPFCCACPPMPWGLSLGPANTSGPSASSKSESE